jgi:hypothetical protein
MNDTLDSLTYTLGSSQALTNTGIITVGAIPSNMYGTYYANTAVTTNSWEIEVDFDSE